MSEINADTLEFMNPNYTVVVVNPERYHEDTKFDVTYRQEFPNETGSPVKLVRNSYELNPLYNDIGDTTVSEPNYSIKKGIEVIDETNADFGYIHVIPSDATNIENANISIVADPETGKNKLILQIGPYSSEVNPWPRTGGPSCAQPVPDEIGFKVVPINCDAGPDVIGLGESRVINVFNE